MNFFEFYELPVKFAIDTVLLRNKFFEKSKLFHPDFHVNASEETKENVLAQSTLNNTVYRTLGNENSRIKYILELYGILSADDKEILPQDFLMEMMELNEEITEMDAEKSPGIKERVGEIENDLRSVAQELYGQYDATGNKDLLQSVKINYLKQKYLLRIKESMLKFAAL